MKIQKFLHSCLLIEENGGRILVDPGLYSFIEGHVNPEVFKDIDAILVTHEHYDHVDAQQLPLILKNNSNASVYSNGGVAASLAKVGITVLPFEEGKKMIGKVEVEAVFAQHATILVPAPKNTAYIIGNKLLITGDSFAEHLESIQGIKVLALPIMAPWLRAIDAVAFAEALKVKTVIPVHDGFAKDFFLERQYPAFAKRFAELGIGFRPLGIGEILEV